MNDFKPHFHSNYTGDRRESVPVQKIIATADQWIGSFALLAIGVLLVIAASGLIRGVFAIAAIFAALIVGFALGYYWMAPKWRGE